jgi:NhaP-type Na+/H+ or K+/H+ antiporter
MPCLAQMRLVRRPSACFAGAMTNLRRPARSSWRALTKLVVVAVLLGVAVAAGVWWVLVMLGNEAWSWVPQFPG